jgi:hypothetical protein
MLCWAWAPIIWRSVPGSDRGVDTKLSIAQRQMYDTTCIRATTGVLDLVQIS